MRISLADRICNEEIHRMASTREDVTVRIKKNVLSWFGHFERMSDEKLMMEKLVVREVGGDLGRPLKTQYQRYWRNLA